MRLTVRVVGHAVEFFPGRQSRFELEFDHTVTIGALIDKLGVSRALVMTAVVDGRRRDFAYQPPDGSEVVLMTPPAGG